MTFWTIKKLIICCLLFVSCSGMTPEQTRTAIDILGMAVEVFVLQYGQPTGRYYIRSGGNEVYVYPDFVLSVHDGKIVGIETIAGGGE